MSEPYWVPLDASSDAAAGAAVVYVAAGGSSSNDGSSWAKAKRQIDEAIAVLPSGGGQVLVGPGTYDKFTLTDAKARVEVRAVGAATISPGVGQVGVAINASGAGGTPLVGPLVEGFLIDGGAGGEAGSTVGIRLTGMSRATVRRCRIANCYSGIDFFNDAGLFTERNSIENTLINNCAAGVRFVRTATGHTSFSYNRLYNVGVDNCTLVGVDISSAGGGVPDLFGSTFHGVTVWLQDANAVGVSVDGNMLGVVAHIDVEWQAGAGAVGWDVLANASNLDLATLVCVFIGNWTGAFRTRLAAGKQIRFLPTRDKLEVRSIAEGLRGQTFDRSGGVQGAQALTAGTIQGSLLPVRVGDTITSLVVVVSANAAAATLVKLGLYDVAGTKIRESADQSAAFNAGAVPRVVIVPLTTPLTITGVETAVYPVILSVGGTPPTVLRGVNLGASSLRVGAGAFPHTQIGAGGQTDLPASGSVNATGLAVWFGWL